MTGRSEELSIISKDTKQTAQHPVNACQDLNAHAIVSSDEDNEEEEMSVNVGDSVAVAVGEDELVDLQKNFGGCTQRMKEVSSLCRTFAVKTKCDARFSRQSACLALQYSQLKLKLKLAKFR